MVPSSLKFLPGVGLGRGVKFLIYFLEGRGGGGSGQPGNPSGYTLEVPKILSGILPKTSLVIFERIALVTSILHYLYNIHKIVYHVYRYSKHWSHVKRTSLEHPLKKLNFFLRFSGKG